MNTLGRAVFAVALCLATVVAGAHARAAGTVADIVGGNARQAALARALFPLLSAASDSQNRTLLAADPVLRTIADDRVDAIRTTLERCPARAPCLAQAAMLDQTAIERAAAQLRGLYETNPAFRRAMEITLSGPAFARHGMTKGAARLVEAWHQEAAALNHILDTYGVGQPARYAEIDGPTYEIESEAYGRVLAVIAERELATQTAQPVFFAPSLRFALALLDVNHRDEAVRFAPLQAENSLARAKARTMASQAFPYSLIVVPGAGSDRPGIALSPLGKLRVAIAAERWRAKQAPFVLVSGGNVHPPRTGYNEAVEMRRELIQTYGLPAAAVLLEPYARHTTTNLRNAAREIFAAGFAVDRPALIVTDRRQADYIMSEVFAQRCQDELGYRPYQSLKRRSPQEIEFVPAALSTHVDATDPLDP